MSDNRWDRQWQIFHAALEQPEAERATYIRTACGDDDELRELLANLLRAHDGSSDFLEEPLLVSSELLDALEPEGLVGQNIGPYVIRAVIGEGGMGVVYEADQLEPVRRNVALKVIKLGMNTREVVARFELERQALAMMNHPNVAKVHDAGATEDGRPYFVMEHVHGSSITSYCDSNRLSNRERLELCRDVFAGIQHAHQKGLIHRDIKPSNVLIEHQDNERPVPKIIDFGIAKATEQRAAEATVFTAIGRMIGTPAYMSPEQALLQGCDVDIRSDIYSLSVLLYELLTGALPFENQTLLDAGYAEMQRIIREDDPPPPSSRISRCDDETITTLANNRHCNTRILRRELEGDLDWIIMKGLEKDPSRRYESVSSLAADVERHLNDQPVLARAPSPAYRFKKFVRRHTWGMAATAVALLVVIAFVTSTLIQTREIAAALESAEIEKVKSEQVADFLVELLTESDPSVAQGESTTVREALDRGAEKLADELNDQPHIKMTILIQMAGIYRALGLYEKAHELLDLARKISIGNDEPPPSIIGDLYQVLANVYHDEGDLDQAEVNYLKTLDTQRTAHGSHDDVVIALMDLGGLYTDQGNYDFAETHLMEALAMSQKLHDDDNAALGNLMQYLAYNYMLSGDYDAAAPYFDDAVAMDRRMYGDRSLQLATSLSYRAVYKRTVGDYAEAVTALTEALSIYEATLGSSHSYVASTLINLSGANLKSGRLDEAESYAERAAAMYESLFNTAHPNLATAYYQLAAIRSQKGNYATAEQSLRRTIELDRELLGDQHPSVSLDIEQLAVAVKNQGRLEEAETLQRDVLTRRMAKLGADHVLTANAMINLSSILALQGDLEEAEQICVLAIEVLNKSGTDDPKMLAAKTQLADVYWRQKKLNESEALYLEVLQRQRDTLNDDHPDLASTLYGLGVTLLDMGRPAKEVLEEALRIQEAVLGTEHPRTVQTRVALESSPSE